MTGNPRSIEETERDAVNPEHNQGHVAAERVYEQHSRMPDAATLNAGEGKHREYRQGNEEGCYICSLLAERDSLLTRVSELTEEREEALDERDKWDAAYQRLAQEKAAATGMFGNMALADAADKLYRAESRIGSLVGERDRAVRQLDALQRAMRAGVLSSRETTDSPMCPTCGSDDPNIPWCFLCHRGVEHDWRQHAFCPDTFHSTDSGKEDS